MKGLIIKDILNLKKNLNTLIVMFIFYILWSYKFGDPTMLVAMITLMVTMMSITSMSYDDLAKWDKFAIAMPISRKKLVYSKYILSILLSISGVSISIAISYVIKLFNSKISTSELFLSSYIIFIISILFISVVLPLVYKFGVEKSRIMMMAVIAIPMIIAYLISGMGISMPSESQLKLLLWASPILLIITLIISSSISYGIFKKKDL